MNLTVESVSVEERKSYLVEVKALFTTEILESEEKYTMKEIFSMLVPTIKEELEEEKQDDSRIVNIIKANISHQPEHILQLVRQSEGNEGRQIVDQDVKELIANLQG